MRYFLKQFIIYFILISGYYFFELDSALNGKAEIKSSVKFVYEAF